MKRHFWGLVCLCLALATAFSAAAQEDLIGRWTVVETRVGPWHDGHGPKPEADPKLAHATLVFGKKSVKAPPPLGCKKVRYTVDTVPPEHLFQGVLKNPKKDAETLGFMGDRILSVNETCLRGDADVEMDFAMIDTDTAVFGLDNIIYKMKREK